ncbi:phosphatase PAP2 family protein [Rhodoferax sp. 4810]|uniref:undecaprenyl-diphosphate phosphatase n=1 Tax=Thiospirillum jenense TaxID=1653858 RepID=A0A839H8X3_9GAMM|nr:phosphatase PAP2 family protein [Thiospirillum jenense]MBB1073937.1 phosphatase PAP2 family protein [Rhodoferax jenense]MBB1125813.1 phosphatase PAP2 family protein [Thiospirillum jenense]
MFNQALSTWYAVLKNDLNRAAHLPNTPPERRFLLMITAALVLITLALWSIGDYHSGFIALNAWAHQYPNKYWAALTLLGDERLLLVITLIIARRSPHVFWSLIISALIAALYARGLKPLFDAARPPAVLTSDAFYLIGNELKRHSFPSGHSVTAGVFFAVLMCHYRWIEWRLLFGLLAILVGFSRIAIGVHWPIDVTAGLAGGVFAAWLGIGLAQHYQWGITSGWLHTLFIIIAISAALSLIISGSGYPHVDLMVRGVAAVALGMMIYLYKLPTLFRRSELN